MAALALYKVKGLDQNWRAEKIAHKSTAYCRQTDPVASAPQAPPVPLSRHHERTTMRPSGRSPVELRKLSITRGYTRHAEGSVLIECGDTKVICTASIEDKVPGFLKGKGQGWLTAEYGMLPRSTHTRMDREAARGKQSGRTQEIQRLIGRALRAAFDLEAFGERTLHLDC